MPVPGVVRGAAARDTAIEFDAPDDLVLGAKESLIKSRRMG